MSRPCPNCNTALSAQTFHGVEVDECLSCAGIWFHAGVMRHLMEQNPAYLIALDTEVVPKAGIAVAAATERRCPDCDVVMTRSRYEYNSPIEIDTCGECFGLWVDDGELAKMEQFQMQQAQTPLPTDVQVKLDMDKFEIEHERYMSRQRFVQGLMGALNQRLLWNPLWLF